MRAGCRKKYVDNKKNEKKTAKQRLVSNFKLGFVHNDNNQE